MPAGGVPWPIAHDAMRAHRRCVRFERKATLCGRRCGAQAERLRTGQLVTSSLVWDDVHVRQSTTLRSRSAGTLSRRRKEANPPTGSSGPRTWSSKRTGSGGSPASSSALLAHSVRQRLADMGGAPSAILIWSMGIPHWMLPPPAIATKRRRHGAEESRTVGGAEGRVRRPSDRRLRGGAPSRSGDFVRTVQRQRLPRSCGGGNDPKARHRDASASGPGEFASSAVSRSGSLGLHESATATPALVA